MPTFESYSQIGVGFMPNTYYPQMNPQMNSMWYYPTQ